MKNKKFTLTGYVIDGDQKMKEAEQAYEAHLKKEKCPENLIPILLHSFARGFHHATHLYAGIIDLQNAQLMNTLKKENVEIIQMGEFSSKDQVLQ